MTDDDMNEIWLSHLSDEELLSLPGAEIVDLARVEDVKGYMRRTKSGKVIQVKAYNRSTSNAAVAERARTNPGRPGIAAASGRFASDRSLPVWPDAGKQKTPEQERQEKERQNQPSYEYLEDTGEVDQETLDKEVPVAIEAMKNLPSNPALRKLISILESIEVADVEVSDVAGLDEVELARKSVKISGYSYFSKRWGKVVHVRPHVQMRNLINALGGPNMAARRGLTPDLVDSALPGYQMSSRVFKTSKETARIRDKGNDFGYTRFRSQNARPNSRRAPEIRSFSLGDPRTSSTKTSANKADNLKKAMSPSHPTAAFRDTRPGTKLVSGDSSWKRDDDGLWRKFPRRNEKGLTDKEMTAKVLDRGGDVEVSIPQTTRKMPERNAAKIDTRRFNPNSKNYADQVKYSKALEPASKFMPYSVADSLNGHISVESSKSSKSYSRMTRIRTSPKKDLYPELIVHKNPEFEKDLTKSLPKQQERGWNVPSTLHPLETQMTRESANYIETLLNTRAPATITQDMYENFNDAYDRHITKDDRDYSQLTGKDGWLARMNSKKSVEVKDQISELLSRSAAEGSDDFIAEAWTEYVANPDAREVSSDFGRSIINAMSDFDDFMYDNKYYDATEIPESVYSRTTDFDLMRSIDLDVLSNPNNVSNKQHAPNMDDIRQTVTFDVPDDVQTIDKVTQRYISIDDRDKVLFDANYDSEGTSAHIDSLEFPQVSPEDVADPVPSGMTSFQMVSSVEYDNDNPLWDILDPERRAMRREERALSMNVNMSQSLIRQFEERAKGDGIASLTANAKAGNDSLYYAHADYRFDPDTTDPEDIRQLFSIMDAYAESNQVSTKMKNSVKKWKNNFSSGDPSTWVTPKEITEWGKETGDRIGPGEDLIYAMNWTGVKNFKPSEVNQNKITTGDLREAVRDITETSPTSVDSDAPPTHLAGMNRILSKVNNDSGFPKSTYTLSGDAKSHTIQFHDKNGKPLVSMDVTQTSDGSVYWSNIEIANGKNAAMLASDVRDNLESVYRAAGLKQIKQPVPTDSKDKTKVDKQAAYALANQGYDWASPLDRDQLKALDKAASKAIRDQADNYKSVQMSYAAQKADNEPNVAAIAKMQEQVDRDAQELWENLNKTKNSLLEKHNNPDDPKGATPYEWASLGKKEALETENTRLLVERSGAGGGGGSVPPTDPDDSNLPEVGSHVFGNNETTDYEDLFRRDEYNRISGDGVQDVITEEKLWEDRYVNPRGTLFELDGDPNHDSPLEFAGKNLLSFGLYDMVKSVEGYWNWLNPDNNKRGMGRDAIGLLYIFLRMMPASPLRGALLRTTTMLTKRSKSPDPTDWPSRQEVESHMKDITARLTKDQIDSMPPEVRGWVENIEKGELGDDD